MSLIVSEEKQKTVDIESVCELLNLVLGSQFQSKVDLLIEYLKVGGWCCSDNSRIMAFFLSKISALCLVSWLSDLMLQIQSDYKAINLDQWMGFLRFCKEVSSFLLSFLHSSHMWCRTWSWFCASMTGWVPKTIVQSLSILMYIL